MLRTGEFQQRAAELGEHLHRELGLLAGGGRGAGGAGARACGRAWTSTRRAAPGGRSPSG